MTEATLGQLFALGSAFCFALSNVFISKGSTGKGDRGVIFSVLVTLVFSFTLWLLIDRGELQVDTQVELIRGVLWFAVAGVFAMVLGRTFIYASLRHLGVTRASALKKATPFFSALLAFVLLGEAITTLDLGGMALIALAFAIMSRKSFQKLSPEEQAKTPALVDYSWGIGASFSYGMSFITRKYGLAYIASPAFGTMISAIVGFLFFLVAAIFSERYRDNMRNLFRNLNRWLVLAAIFVSCGQIFIFAALSYETVATVAIISSLEVFLSSFLAVVIFKAEKRPGWDVYLAAVIAVVGAIAVAM